MAKRRMISSDVINTDKFLAVSLAARGLYMHLNSEADDDGFISAPLKIVRAVDAKVEMLDELTQAGFLIKFESGIYLIRHWLIHNSIQGDRYTFTMNTKEAKQIVIADKIYYLQSEAEAECIQDVNRLEPKVRKEKNSKGKNKTMQSKPPSEKNQFNQMMHTQYDYAEIERRLLQ